HCYAITCPIMRLSRSRAGFRRIDGIIERQNPAEHAHRLKMNRVRPYIKTSCLAASLFVLDVFILNQGLVAVILILLALFVFVPIALFLRRRDKRKYEQRLVKIAIYVVTGVAVLTSNTLQNRLADRRAIAIGNACLAYRAKYHQYPAELNDL